MTALEKDRLLWTARDKILLALSDYCYLSAEAIKLYYSTQFAGKKTYWMLLDEGLTQESTLSIKPEKGGKYSIRFCTITQEGRRMLRYRHPDIRARVAGETPRRDSSENNRAVAIRLKVNDCIVMSEACGIPSCWCMKPRLVLAVRRGICEVVSEPSRKEAESEATESGVAESGETEPPNLKFEPQQSYFYTRTELNELLYGTSDTKELFYTNHCGIFLTPAAAHLVFHAGRGDLGWNSKVFMRFRTTVESAIANLRPNYGKQALHGELLTSGILFFKGKNQLRYVFTNRFKKRHVRIDSRGVKQEEIIGNGLEQLYAIPLIPEGKELLRLILQGRMSDAMRDAKQTVCAAYPGITDAYRGTDYLLRDARGNTIVLLINMDIMQAYAINEQLVKDSADMNGGVPKEQTVVCWTWQEQYIAALLPACNILTISMGANTH